MNDFKKTYKNGIYLCGTKLKYFAHYCRNEINRTKKIGTHMIFASKINSELRENYEELGKNIVRAYEAGQIIFPNSKCSDLYYKITQAQKEISDLDFEINKIKFSSGPEVIREDSDHGSSLH